MIFLYVFLGIILLLIFLLCFPIFVSVRFDESLKLKIRFLFFLIDLPAQKDNHFKIEEKFVDNNKKVKTDLVNNKFFSIIKEKGFFGFLKILKYVVDVIFYSTKKILKKIHISKFNLCLLVASKNAADTAINYGKIYAFINYSKAVLLQNVDERNCYIEVVPGFNESECRVDFYSKFYFFPISMVGIVFSSVFKFIKKCVLAQV